MANETSYIGAVIAVSASTPATFDGSGFAALSYTTVGKIVAWGAVGDTSASIDVPLLSGRIVHINGALDGGSIAWTVAYDTDSGQTILKNNSNGTTRLSFKITDPDGQVSYNWGLVADVQDQERNNSNYKGLTGVARINSATVRV